MQFAPILTKDAEPLASKSLDFAFNIDVKAVGEDGVFEGYASVWNIVDQGGDSVQPGAFIAGLTQAKADGRLIPMLWQHDRTQPIGVWLDISEDTKGLYVKGQLLINDVPQARAAYALLKNKAIGGLSIGYRIPMGGAEEDSKRRGVWLLKKVDLIEISLVTIPMLTQAKVTAVKNILDSGLVPTVREFEGFLRDAGFSREKATAIASVASPHLRGEPEGDGDSDALERFERAMKSGLSAINLKG